MAVLSQWLRRGAVLVGLVIAFAVLAPDTAFAHGVSSKDARYLLSLQGPAIAPLMYLGAKHMVTGYDHLLFLVGVIFFLYRLKDIVLYVSLFTVGHSVTLLAGALGGIHANAYLVDAVIGVSVVYKAFENMGGFKALGFQPDTRAAVLVFGLVHGFGLATKLQEYLVVAERPGHEHRELQRRRRDRTVPRADRCPAGARLLAHAAGYLRHAYADQRGADDRRLRPRRLPDDRVFHGGVMIGHDRSARRGAIARSARENDGDRAGSWPALLLVAFVLPAEYAIDPLGTGRRLGLTAIASPPAATESVEAPTNPEAALMIPAAARAGGGVSAAVQDRRVRGRAGRARGD